MAALILAMPVLAGPPVAEPSGAKSQSTAEAESSMSIVIGEDAFDRLPQTVRMRRDLGDPARRTAVREEYKQGLPRFYPDIGKELQLTTEQENRLFDLLADLQMRNLDLFYARPSGAPLEKASRFQDNDSRRDEALLSFLGRERFDKYRHYEQELPERQVVARFTARLDPSDALSFEQTVQLRTVLKEAREQTQSERAERRLQALGTSIPRTTAELLEANIRANEDSLPELEAESRRLLQGAAAFMTTRQLAALSEMERQKLDAQRRSVENLRKNSTIGNSPVAGQSVFISAQAEDAPDAPESRH
jgi:hypothetical protein